MDNWENVLPQPQTYDLAPLRTLVDNSQRQGFAMERFSVMPYLFLCELAYERPDIRLRRLTEHWQFQIFEDNDIKRFAVTCQGHFPNTLIIIFRGTVLTDVNDLRTDMALARREQAEFLNTDRVQREVAFVDILIQDFLRVHGAGRVVLTGHSLGGTIAYEVSKAHPNFDVITFNMGSFAHRIVQQQYAPQQRRGVGLHIRAHGDKLSSNPGDDGSDRNILVKVRLPDTPGGGSFPYHGVKFLLNNIAQIDAAVLRRCAYRGGRRKRQIKATPRKSVKSRKALSMTSKAIKLRKSRRHSGRR